MYSAMKQETEIYSGHNEKTASPAIPIILNGNKIPCFYFNSHPQKKEETEVSSFCI